MILESRSIIFSDDELFVALRPILESRGMAADLPMRAISAKVNDEGEVAATIEMTDGSEPIVIEGGELGPAVLNHCIDHGIPLPRGCYKELAIRGDHVAMIVRLESGSVQSDVDEDEE